ncbi:MAG TPA: hypothetical protein ENI76_04775 [Ignavibacteria bacterium]|nr:hypothetical protein [Ignavibacteria bacterium]
MTSWAVRQLQSEAFLKEKTISPHIDATKKIMEGDRKLLEQLLVADEFDILTASNISIGSIPENFKLAIGFNNLRLIQLYEAAQGMAADEYDKTCLNEFVKNKLKDYLAFNQLSLEEQNSILNTYWDYVDRLSRNSDRMIVFLMSTLIPEISFYLKKKQFKFFSVKEATDWLKKVETILEQHKDEIPNTEEYFNWLKDSGIRKIL